MDEAQAILADAVGPLIWNQGSAGALGTIVESLFEAGRAHQALDLLRVLADPTARQQLGALAQARLDACHDAGGPTLPWAVAVLMNGDESPSMRAIGPGASALVGRVVDEASKSGLGLRHGVAVLLATVAAANDRAGLVADILALASSPAHAVEVASEERPRAIGTVPEVVRRPAPRGSLRAGRVDIALAFDRRAAPLAQVAMGSVVRRTPEVTFHLAVRGVDSGQIDRLAGVLNVPIHAYDFGGVDHGGARSLDHIASPSSLDVLLLPSVLADVDRVVYLDCDVVVAESLASLHGRDIRPFSLGARPIRHGASTIADMVDRRCDRLDRTAALSLRAWVKAAKIADDAPLFNAGVLVMDLAALRQDARLEKVREVMSRCALDDQDGLCLLAGGRFQALERRWNHLAAMDSIERPAVIHWAGVHKPWTHLGTPLEEVWWTEARRLYDEGRLVWPLPRLDGRARWTEEL